MAAWGNFGKLLLADFGEEPESAVIRTQMESGPPKQAVRFSRSMVPKPLSYQMTGAEYAAFKTWFSVDIVSGVDWFNWDDPVDGQTKPVRIVSPQGQPPYIARAFIEADGAPLSWIVTFRIESWEPNFGAGYGLGFG